MNPQLQSIKLKFGIIGTSTLLDTALDTAIRVAPTDLSVLITGESGTGKEVFSKVIHSLSPRKHNEFIAVNCGAIPEGTINSELFGHEKGAFTGAAGERKGYFETVNGGTIFLDEIGEMPLDTQAYLLRVLESGEFMRVGSSKVEKTDVRVIAATNVDLEERVRANKFREDLFYRLNTVPIRVPALKDRSEDIAVLFRKFAHDFAEKYRMAPVKLDEKSILVLENYRWPGNIRELKNVAEQLSVLNENREITVEHLHRMMPQLFQRNLPMGPGKDGFFENGSGNFQEREILYKLLFDMKNDLIDLKSLVFELVKSNNLHMPEIQSMQNRNTASLPGFSLNTQPYPSSNRFANEDPELFYAQEPGRVKPIILDQSAPGSYEKTEVMDEPLAMDEIEKDAIRKALKKYNGRRKEAAEELKISERTLYRKIKEYGL